MNPFEATKAPTDAITASSSKRSPEIVVMPEKYYGVALKMDAREMEAKEQAATAPAPVPPPPPKPKQALVPMAEERPSPWPYIALATVVLLLIGGGFVYVNRDAFFGAKPPVVVTPPIVELPTVSVPTVPTGLTASAVSGTQSIALSWFDSANNESGFRLERATADGAFAVLTNLPANSTSFLDVSVSSGLAYRYRISAVNEGGASPTSNEAQAVVASAQVAAPSLPPGGLDSDSDGLSDSEELVFSTDPRNPDSDRDGFLDGNEVFHLYNPAAQAPVKILDTTLVKSFKGSLGWSMITPSIWQSSLDIADGERASIVTGQGERFLIEVLANEQQLSAKDWYLAKNTTTTAQMLRSLTTKQGLEGILSPDRLEAVFSWGSKVFRFRYSPDDKPFINYRTIYEMMLNSLELEGAPVQVITPEESSLNGPGDVVGASSTSSMETIVAPTSTATSAESIVIPSSTTTNP